MLQHFGNGQALDWLTDLLVEDDVYFIHNTLEIIADYPDSERPDEWDCNCALAAAEMVAAARGKPAQEFPPPARTWLKTFNVEIDDELLALAKKAVERIQSNSELKAVWDESPDAAEWYEAMSDLSERLVA